jgi:hypothetical protein
MLLEVCPLFHKMVYGAIPPVCPAVSVVVDIPLHRSDPGGVMAAVIGGGRYIRTVS